MSECKCECKCKCKSAQLKVVKTYHDNDKPHQEYTVNDQGQKHGTYREWYYNGQLWEQSEYVNGKSYGIRYVWYIDGQLREQCEYVNGKLHGTYREWFENGQLYEQSEWVNGIQHGIRYVWGYDGYLSYIEQCHTGNLLVEVIFRQDNQRLKKPIIYIRLPNHAKVGDGLIQVIKVLQEKGIKFKIAKIGDSND